MENYIVSARKYRPETFQTVIGQPAITTTLKNAIRTRQLAHAYLFCGPRGIGKTTCARIFAKTINCFHITENTEACNECESCLSFNSSRSYNIHELDGASNNSVDDIRSLIEQVRIPPQIGKYSIYIIDEVHMLSPNAFNAFLKTLEEPPSHAIFILATTEKHKIIPTILSRCQIFDFNRIKMEDIAIHLENIAKAENIEAERAGLDIISQKADGAMRDALSIFDQIVSFSGGKITYQNVIDNLNVLDYDYFFRLTDSILTGNIPAALMIFNEVLDRGFDGHNFINGLSRHFRDLLVCRDEVTIQLLEVGAAIREQYRTQSKSCSHEFILNALDLTNKCDLSFRSSRNQRLHVELCLVQLCSLQTGEKKKSEPSEGLLKQSSSQKEPARAGTGSPVTAGNITQNKAEDSNTSSSRNTGITGDGKSPGSPIKPSDIHSSSGASPSTQGENTSGSSMSSRMTTGGNANPQGPSTSSIKGLITKSNRQDREPDPADNAKNPVGTSDFPEDIEKSSEQGRNISRNQTQGSIGNSVTVTGNSVEGIGDTTEGSEGSGNIAEGIGDTAEGSEGSGNIEEGIGDTAEGSEGSGNIAEGIGDTTEGSEGSGNIAEGIGDTAEGSEGSGNIEEGIGDTAEGSEGSGKISKGTGDASEGNEGTGKFTERGRNISEGSGNVEQERGKTGNTATESEESTGNKTASNSTNLTAHPYPASQLDIIDSYGINNTLSIKDALRGTQIKKENDPADNTDEVEIDNDDLLVAAEDGDDFTEKDLQEQWKKFANQISGRQPRLYNTLLANKPSITSQSSIEFEISNPLQLEALDKLKPELLGHLRRELNRNLELLFVINETIKESRLYQPEDKYEHMVKKNPALAIFKQKFNLDFD